MQDFLGFSDTLVPLLPSPALIAYLRPGIAARTAVLFFDMVRMTAAALTADMAYGMVFSE